VSGAAVSNRLCGYKGRFGTFYVSRLSQGAAISNCTFLPPAGQQAILFDFYGGGGFFDPGIGFVGIRFNNGAGMQYGWARIYRLHSRTGFVLVDYAWGDPGDQVRAGQTTSASDQPAAVPAQGSLGLLALGGAGLVAWRKRRTTERH
jgi:MYXO-CTERM domain-containing protein